MADISLNESDEVTIADSAGTNKLTVNIDGSTNIEFRNKPQILIDGRFPVNTQDIPSSVKSLVLSGTVPTAKTWLLTNWSAGGRGKGTAELATLDTSGEVETLLDACDSITSWAKGGSINSFVLDTADKYEGAASIRVSVDFSGAGIQTGKMTKTYVSPIDLTPYESLKVVTKAAENNCTVFIKVFQGGSTYTYTPQVIAKNIWSDISFDLSEILAFSPTAVDKIELNFTETVDYKKDFFIWIDYIHGGIGAVKNIIGIEYFSAFTSTQTSYPRYISFAAGTTINLSIANNDATTLQFSASYTGLEV